MTDTLTTRPAGADRPGSGSGRRLARSIAYDVLLVPLGLRTMADAVVAKEETAGRRWLRWARFLDANHDAAAKARPRRAHVFGVGLLGAVVGLAAWFVLMLTGIAVIRGPFYGFVEHGPFGPGTWGGPTKAGAWAVHAAVSVPCIVGFLLALRGIAALQSRLVRPLYGAPAPRWVLPATIGLAGGCVFFFWSWLLQL